MGFLHISYELLFNLTIFNPIIKHRYLHACCGSIADLKSGYEGTALCNIFLI